MASADPNRRGEDGLGALIGLEPIESGPDRARARVAVSDRIRQPYGIVHGATYAVIAESICSRATAEAVADDEIAVGQANQATLLRPIADGHVNATATVRHRGRTTWVWDCELSDDDGRVCALVRITIAVRPRR
ncbi:MAG TPA: PaaI family thioesterase [Solirubrobacterales bacterium]|nr:PaaI family thioesterase [Solirubrobacterales bacterium]